MYLPSLSGVSQSLSYLGQGARAVTHYTDKAIRTSFPYVVRASQQVLPVLVGANLLGQAQASTSNCLYGFTYHLNNETGDYDYHTCNATSDAIAPDGCSFKGRHAVCLDGEPEIAQCPDDYLKLEPACPRPTYPTYYGTPADYINIGLTSVFMAGALAYVCLPKLVSKCMDTVTYQTRELMQTYQNHHHTTLP